jgi:hypothetical protein
VNNPRKVNLFKTFFSQQKQEITSEQRRNERAFSRVCLLRDSSENDFNDECKQDFQKYIMCRVDRLSEAAMLLTKIASNIGNSFSRIVLWNLVDPQSKQSININSCVAEMMQRIIIECAYKKQQNIKTRSIKCYCLQNPGGQPFLCRRMVFTHSIIREGIYNALPVTLKRMLTRNIIDYLEKQCAIVCFTCGNGKYDRPFLIYQQDSLRKMIQNRQQYHYFDIVQTAALNEIDNIIKQLVRLPTYPIRQQSVIPSKTVIDQNIR